MLQAIRYQQRYGFLIPFFLALFATQKRNIVTAEVRHKMFAQNVTQILGRNSSVEQESSTSKGIDCKSSY